MTIHRLLQPAGWHRPIGHANGVEARGRQVFLGAQVGWNADSLFESHELVDQVRQALANVNTLLAEAGAGPQHITRMNWYLIDQHDYRRKLPEIGVAYLATIGRHFPPMTTVQVQSLLEEDALVAIEVTAVVADS